MSVISNYLSSSIGKKQIVALTGLGLILFVFAHLAGNMIIFAGHEAFNAYGKKMQSLGPLLWVMRGGLLMTFLIHMGFTISVIIENRRARLQGYKEFRQVGKRSLATRTMSISGIVIFTFVIFHLKDFTLEEHHGLLSMIHGKDYGLYGLVVNSFLNPIRASLYIVAVFAVGLHVSHAFESALQSFGLNHLRITPVIIKVSRVMGLLLALGYSAIPIYVLFLLER